MDQPTMYPGKINSPGTTLSSQLNSGDVLAHLTSVDNFPVGPNLAVLGVGDLAETVLYTTRTFDNGVSGPGTLSGLTRGFQGLAATWVAGSPAARNFTDYDYETLVYNITKITTGRKTIYLSLAGGWASAVDGDSGLTKYETAGGINIVGTKFIDSTVTKYHEFGCPLPDNWDLGTLLARPYFYTDTASGTGTITFGLQGVTYSDGDVLDTSYGIAQTSTTTVSTNIAYKMKKGPTTSAITIGGTPSKGDYVQFRTYRLGSDTFQGNAYLLGWLLTYSTNNFTDE